MGVSDASAIQQAGEFLVAQLLETSPLPYSTFYDGKEETRVKLCHAIGLVDEEGEPDDWYSVENLIDLAVAQLEEQGIVSVQKLTTKLVDDEDDYSIELTAAGRAKLSAGLKPRFRDME